MARELTCAIFIVPIYDVALAKGRMLVNESLCVLVIAEDERTVGIRRPDVRTAGQIEVLIGRDYATTASRL
jgi:hypothetical protein